MFSIAAINDADSRGGWEPLAPTKEAQEFRLSQLYHEGLSRLQAKDLVKARENLEAALKDPLLSSTQVESNGSDGHLLQLRFLVLKNLASVFLQQGSAYHEKALQCYLQAVEIDTKDSVVWNQLGTLSCSMGLLSISRWAFEQGLVCSPNNWSCMEKLLEVLIAIGDEIACLSVAELILMHWPSHSRALYVKTTIEEESERVSFSPRGIDKLVPKHIRLQFLKRKEKSDDMVEGVPSKKLKETVDVLLTEASWNALAWKLLDIMNALVSDNSEKHQCRSGDVTISIQLPNSARSELQTLESKGSKQDPTQVDMSIANRNMEKDSPIKEKEASVSENQPQERRSSRLERLRSQKPGKEDSDFATTKDLSKVILQILRPFLLVEGKCSSEANASSSSDCAKAATRSQDSELTDVIQFIQKTLNNYGAYHMGHLLLEEVSSRTIFYKESNAKLLDLEKLTRQWGHERSPNCSLFLAELCYDFGLHSSDSSSEYISEASYHLCKVIESVALECPFQDLGVPWDEGSSGRESFSDNSQFLNSCHPLSNNYSFWVRFFWLSGRLSVVDGNKEKARKEFSMSLSLLGKEGTPNNCAYIYLPHCKVTQNITTDRIVNEISLLEVDLLMKKTVPDMIEKHMYSECLDKLVPLLFSAKEVHLDAGDVTGIYKEFQHVELSALNALMKSCEQAEQMDIEIYLRCHKRKLYLLMSAAGLIDSNKGEDMKSIGASVTESKESQTVHWNHLVVEEVKAISECILRIKCFNPSERWNGVSGPMTITSDIQSLLLELMHNVADKYICKKSSGFGAFDQNDQGERLHFVDAAIAFCKLQHLNPDVAIKTQAELLVAMHDMLAEFGLCCAHGSDDEEEGAFLKFAIKHLLALDMKLKSNLHTINTIDNHAKGPEQTSHNFHAEGCRKESKMIDLNAEVDQSDRDENCERENDDIEMRISEDIATHVNIHKDKTKMECDKDDGDQRSGKFRESINKNNKTLKHGDDITEDEREELELEIDNALDQCFYCLYGLNLRSESSYEDDLAVHRNTSRGDYQTKEQCADVFQYIIPYAKASTRTGLIKIRRVLRAIRKHFPQPPTHVLEGNAIDKFLDNPDICEDELSEEAGSEGFLDSVIKKVFSDPGIFREQQASLASSEPYYDVYCNLYRVLALSEEINATDKWAGFVLTKEGEEFVQQNAKLFKYDLIYNPLRFESWQRLADIYDEEVDLLLNDGSKQINVSSWRKNDTFPQRVETSRRRSRRCLLMTLALAKTATQQGEIHELLALVYYDGIQNVVPFYDQRYISPSKDRDWLIYCQNSMKHFKKAFEHKEDWSHAFYMGKLCEKLNHSKDVSFLYYAKAIALNPSAVDPFYRMHASRLKLLCACGKRDQDAMKIVAAHSFLESTKLSIINILGKVDPEISESVASIDERKSGDNSTSGMVDLSKLEEMWHMLYSDCLSALEICVEGELKHFHKARYMLAQAFYRRGECGDLEKAKEEMSFCFKSSRSPFTINMWEIDSTVKKGRRKTQSLSTNRKTLEVYLAESSRKFITCIRKYILFYLRLLEETGDTSTLDRAYLSLRTDKRFSLCIEDIVPVALGRYIKTLISSINQSRSSSNTSANSGTDQLLEKLFSLFLEQFNLWSEICSLPEIKTPELTDSYLYGYLYQYIESLEVYVKVEALEGINEKIRKRLKNPKLSNSNCAKVYKNVCVAWCRSLVISMALITPLHSRLSSEIHIPGLSGGGVEHPQLLCVDLQSDELWSSSSEDLEHLKNLETKWNPSLCKIKNVIVKRVSDEDLETAAMLLRSSYSFYKDTSCALLPSGINLYMVPSQLATETYVQPGIDGVDILDMNTARKLLMWAFTLFHGYCPNLAAVIKYCEDNMKLKVKKGTGSPFTAANASTPSATISSAGCGLNGMGKSNEADGSLVSSLSETDGTPKSAHPSSPEKHKSNNGSLQEAATLAGTPNSSLPEGESMSLANASASPSKNQEDAPPQLPTRTAEEETTVDLNQD